MRQSSVLFTLLGTIGFCGLLSGCSGGGGGEASTGTGGTAGRSAAASGSITDFGSVVVNGKRFDTSRASFEVDGQPGRQDDATLRQLLKLGMTVTVIGSFNGNQWSAETLLQKDAVEGPVELIAIDGLSLMVMGQTVMIDSTTIIDNGNGLNGDIRNLVPGDIAEVNGHVRPGGVIQATFIEKKVPNASATATPEVRGFVSAHDHSAKTFRIGDLIVNYQGAFFGDMPSPSVNDAWNGLFVELKETDSGRFNPATMTLSVTTVEPERFGLGNPITTVEDFEVEGFVTLTQVDGTTDFLIGTTRVRMTANTLIQGGALADIAVGAKVSAEGRLAGGILTATQVILSTRASAGTAVIFGFDDLSRGGYNATLTGAWDHVGTDVFSVVSNSAIIVQGNPTATIDEKGRPRVNYPEFTFQGVDLSSRGASAATFVVAGYRTGDDRLPTFFRTVTLNINGSLRLLNSGLDDSQRPMNVKIDELRITGVGNGSVEFGVSCLGIGTTGGDPGCSAVTQ
jgi:Domain of unknown function (DUF5666)